MFIGHAVLFLPQLMIKLRSQPFTTARVVQVLLIDVSSMVEAIAVCTLNKMASSVVLVLNAARVILVFLIDV